MAFNALLMCSQEPVLRVLGTALEEVEMEPEVCVSAPEALDLTVVRHYSALVLGFDLPGAATVARMARLVPSSRRPVVCSSGVCTLTWVVGKARVASYTIRPAIW